MSLQKKTSDVVNQPSSQQNNQVYKARPSPGHLSKSSKSFLVCPSKYNDLIFKCSVFCIALL